VTGAILCNQTNEKTGVIRRLCGNEMQLHRGFRRDAWILFLDYGRLMGDPIYYLLFTLAKE
jgi:hypothetical protein